MERIVFDYAKLKGRIVEKFGSQKAFAKSLHMTEATLTLKLKCISYFSQSEILNSANLLDISPDAFAVYFFTPKVQ